MSTPLCRWGILGTAPIARKNWKAIRNAGNSTLVAVAHPRRLAVHEYSNGPANAQETNMIRTLAQIVISDQLQPRWGEQALATQQVLDALLCSARQDSGRVAVAE